MEHALHDDISIAALIFKSNIKLQERLGNPSNIEEFENHKDKVATNLQKIFTANIHDMLEPQKFIEVIMAKISLYEIVFQQLLSLSVSISPLFGNNFKKLYSIHSGLVTEIYEASRDLSTMTIIAQKELEINKKDSLEKVKESAQSDTTVIQKENIALKKKVSDLMDTIKLLQQQQKDTEEPFNMDDQWMFPTTIPSYLDPATIAAFGNFNQINDDIRILELPFTQSQSMNDVKVSRDMSTTSSISQEANLSKDANFLANRLNLSTYASHQSPELWLFKFRTDLQKEIESTVGVGVGVKKAGTATTTGSRLLSIQQCKEIIQHIYDSKPVCSPSSHLGALSSTSGTMNPSITSTGKEGDTWGIEDMSMEYHVYLYFEKKYGLKSLVIKHTSLFLQSLRHHLSTSQTTNIPLNAHTRNNTISTSNGWIKRIDIVDTELYLFYKLFIGSIDMSGRDLYIQLQNDIYSVIASEVQANGCPRDSPAYHTAINEITSGVVDEEFWMGLLGAVFNEKDIRLLNECLQGAAFDYSIKERENSKRAVFLRKFGNKQPSSLSQNMSASAVMSSSTKRLPFKTVLETLLYYQLTQYETYLYPLYDCFQYYDTDADGWLDRSSLFDCLERYLDQLNCHQKVVLKTGLLYDSSQFVNILEKSIVGLGLNACKRYTFTNLVAIFRSFSFSIT